MMHYDYGYGHWLGFPWMVIFWIAFFLLLVWLTKNHFGPREKTKEILKRRLAKGEISKKEFDDIKKKVS